MIFIVYIGWELFFVSQLMALNKAICINKENHFKRNIFIAHNAVLAAKPLGIWIAAFLWNDGNGLIYVGIILISCVIICINLYLIYFRKINKQQYLHVSTRSDTEYESQYESARE
eukprot:163810_1